MRKKFFVLSMLIFLSILVTVLSCNKDSFGGKSDDQISLRNEGTSKAQIYEIRKAFAQTFYKALTAESDLRSFIHEKCLIADTSGYELVYLSLKDNAVTRSLSFAQLLTQYADPAILQRFGDDFFNKLTDLTPLLTISFPDLENVQLSAWNSNIIPGVAAVSTIHDRAFTMYNANRLNGNEIILNDLQTEEDFINTPVLVIYDAENHYLVNDQGVTIYGNHIDEYMPKVPRDPKDTIYEDCWKYYLKAQYSMRKYKVTNDQYYLIEHDKLLERYLICKGLISGGGDPPNPCNQPCQRDCETKDEHIVDFKINGWGVYESIDNQAFERFYKFQASALLAFRDFQGTISTMEIDMITKSYSKKDLLDCTNHNLHPCQGKWVTENYRIWTDWQKDNMGSPYQVEWAEVDSGSGTLYQKTNFGTTFSITDTNTGATIEDKRGIEMGYSFTGDKIVTLGNQRVFYCDPIMMENSTTSITFRCD